VSKIFLKYNIVRQWHRPLRHQ